MIQLHLYLPVFFYGLADHDGDEDEEDKADDDGHGW